MLVEPAVVSTPARRSGLISADWMARLTLIVVSIVGVAAFGWPFLLNPGDAPGGANSHSSDAPWLFAGLTALLGAVVAAELSRNRLDAKSVAVLGVLASIGGALRVVSAGAANLEPMFFLLVLAGRVLGPGGGFLLGNLAIAVGAVLTGGIGPWLPFQMLTAGWVCLGAGLLPRRVGGRAELWMLGGYGLVTGLAYGAVMNLWFWAFLTDPTQNGIYYVPGAGAAENLRHYAAFYLATSLAWDLPRGVLTFVLCLVAGRRILSSLRRGTRHAVLLAPVRPA